MKAPGSSHSKVSYRADIDGLRAVAVLLVIGAHLGTQLSGGYIGVDIFFVISGYLISAHILSEMRAGRFSIVSFYERRIRRIFPALLVMLAGTTGLAYLHLFPEEFLQYMRSMLAAVFSVSNILFWRETGYFDAPSLFKPLLHTWSLAVEEQFYLLFPIFLVIIRRFAARHLKAAIYSVSILTFVLAQVFLRNNSSAVFFLAPFRAWELLIGTVLSQGYLPRLNTSLKRNSASIAGLLMIAIPAWRYTAATPFPGLYALPPCFGAALIIAAGETGSSLIGRLLSLRPVAFVGLISYSLYLWHWPLIVFQNTAHILGNASITTHGMKGWILLTSLIAATLSWAFVEEPFRKGRFRPSFRPLLWINGTAVALLTLFGIVGLASKGLPSRFPQDALRAASYMDFDWHTAYRWNSCFMSPESHLQDYHLSTCMLLKPDRKSFLLIGDSHAAQLWPGLSAIYPQLNMAEATVAHCRPFLHQARDASPMCQQMSSFLFKDFLPHHHIDTILIAAQWEEGDEAPLQETINLLRTQGASVVLIGPTLEYELPLPRLIAASLREKNSALVDRSRIIEPQRLDRKLSMLARQQWNVPYISFYGNLCGNGCPVFTPSGVPVLFDSNHFTREGSILFAQTIRDRNQIP